MWGCFILYKAPDNLFDSYELLLEATQTCREVVREGTPVWLDRRIKYKPPWRQAKAR